MDEESLAFYALFWFRSDIAAGYDSWWFVVFNLIGAASERLGSTINPFATVIAANAAKTFLLLKALYCDFILLSGRFGFALSMWCATPAENQK